MNDTNKANKKTQMIIKHTLAVGKEGSFDRAVVETDPADVQADVVGEGPLACENAAAVESYLAYWRDPCIRCSVCSRCTAQATDLNPVPLQWETENAACR